MSGILTDAEIKEIEKEQGFSFRETFTNQAQIEENLNREYYNFESSLFNFNVDFRHFCFGLNTLTPVSEISFRSSYFAGTSNFSNSSFYADHINFEAITFNKDADFSYVIFVPLKGSQTSFDHAIFEQKADFQQSTFDGVVFFTYVSFNGDAIFFNCNILSSIRFSFSKFNSYSFFNVETYNNDNQDNVSNWIFWNNKFRKETTFENRVFYFVKFSNDRFEEHISFKGCTFLNDLLFDQIKFQSTATFSNARFYGRTTFFDTDIYRRLSLRETYFKEGLNLATTNLVGEGYLSTFGIKVEDFKAINENVNIDQGENWKKISNTHKRETYRILKHEALQQNNRIEALNFHAKEMDTYWEELKKEKWYKDEKLLLWANKISNGYGLSWLQGIKFTLIAGVALYALYVSLLALLVEEPFIWQWNGFSEMLKALGLSLAYFPEFLNPAHRFDFISENYPGIPLWIDAIGRIFIGFGIYQTIQAFRKYGRF